jgi:hypothetical protein
MVVRMVVDDRNMSSIRGRVGSRTRTGIVIIAVIVGIGSVNAKILSRSLEIDSPRYG